MVAEATGESRTTLTTTAKAGVTQDATGKSVWHVKNPTMKVTPRS